RNTPAELREIELDGLGTACHVGDAKYRLIAVFAQIGEDFAVLRVEEPQRSAPERMMLAAHPEHAAHPVEQGMRIAALRLDVYGLEAVKRVHDGGKHQRGGIGARKSTVAIRRPLHRRAHAVAITEMDIVPHSDLVAIVDDWSAWHGEQQAV